MRFYVISDNVDTQVGMRLAGIEGVVVHEEDEVVRLCPELVDDLKLNRSRPLIVEIPDRHSNGRAKDSITRYVQDAIGVRL